MVPSGFHRKEPSMPEFLPGQPIATDVADIEVSVTPASPLPVGRHRFSLVVVDDSGNQSEPDVHEVIVRDATRPTAVLDGPREVPFGQSFQLNGRRSSDPPPGRIVRYQWTRLP
jgi:hypothetical protein